MRRVLSSSCRLWHAVLGGLLLAACAPTTPPRQVFRSAPVASWTTAGPQVCAIEQYAAASRTQLVCLMKTTDGWSARVIAEGSLPSFAGDERGNLVWGESSSDHTQRTWRYLHAGTDPSTATTIASAANLQRDLPPPSPVRRSEAAEVLVPVPTSTGYAWLYEAEQPDGTWKPDDASLQLPTTSAVPTYASAVRAPDGSLVFTYADTGNGVVVARKSGAAAWKVDLVEGTQGDYSVAADVFGDDVAVALADYGGPLAVLKAADASKLLAHLNLQVGDLTVLAAGHRLYAGLVESAGLTALAFDPSFGVAQRQLLVPGGVASVPSLAASGDSVMLTFRDDASDNGPLKAAFLEGDVWTAEVVDGSVAPR